MKNYLWVIMVIALAGCSSSKNNTANSKATTISNSAEILPANKKRIKENDAALLPAYKQLLKEADKALTEGPFTVMEKTHVPPSGDKHDYMSLAPYHWPDPTKPNGLPYMRKDGETNPEVKEYKDKEYMPKLGELVHTLALAYYFSGNEKYAKHAANLLRVWFVDTATKMNPNLNFAQAIKGVNTGRGAGMIDARHFLKVIEAISLLTPSDHWKTTDEQGMKNWFRDFLHWMQTSKNGMDEMNARNNHGTFYDAQRLGIALYLDSATLAKRVIENVKKRLDYQMDTEGKFPKEMERTTSFHYSSFNMEAFFKIAAMAEKMGIDLWNYISPSGNSLQKGFEFLRPYLTNKKTWEGQQIKPYDFEKDAFPLLMIGARQYNCTECKEAIRTIGKEKSASLRIHLLH
jgi:hypothetical protein